MPSSLDWLADFAKWYGLGSCGQPQGDTSRIRRRIDEWRLVWPVHLQQDRATRVKCSEAPLASGAYPDGSPPWPEQARHGSTRAVRIPTIPVKDQLHGQAPDAHSQRNAIHQCDRSAGRGQHQHHDRRNIMTAGQRGPGLLQDIWLIDNCTQADPAYGAGVARALGLTTAVAAE
jgi:hypothetical protein